MVEVSQSDVAITPAGALIVLALIAMGLLLRSRTRFAGAFAILVMVLFGACLGLYSMRGGSAPARITNLHDYEFAYDAAIQQQQLVSEAHAMAAEAQAIAQAEIVKNQRMAAIMPDATVQNSPDGSTLETYPDGMQIRELYQTRERVLVRDSDRNLRTNKTMHESVHLKGRVAMWLLGAPIAVVAVAFLAIRAKNGGGSRWVMGFALLAVAAMLLTFLRVASVPRVIIGEEAATAELPMVIHNHDGVTIQVPRVEGTIITPTSEPSRTKPAASVGGSGGVAALPQVSIESLWDKLTKPSIQLEPPNPVRISPTKAEVAQAAKIILAASAPVADPFTQGWLVNAAKAIVQAVPKVEQQEGGTRSLAEAMEEPIAAMTAQQRAQGDAPFEYPPVQQYVYDDPSVRVAELALEEISGPAPEWIGDPPQVVGNVRRVPVKSDPFTTVNECQRQLKQKVESIVQERIRELARNTNGQHAFVPELHWLGITPEYVAAELCPQGEYVETLSVSVGPMKRVHTLVEFAPAQDQFLLDSWLRYARLQNLEVVAGLSSLVVAGLALVFGLLKLDTWTRGYYTKRLFLGVPAAIIAVFFLSAEIFGW